MSMQRWTSFSSRCLFCAFRNTRPYSKTSIRAERPERLSRSAKKKARSNSTPKETTFSITRTLRTTERDIADDVIARLSFTRERLKSSKITEDDQFSQLRQLDPDKVLWPSFESYITTLAKTRYHDRSNEQEALWNRLVLAHKTSKHRIDKELCFAFMDFTADRDKKPLHKITATGAVVDLRYPTEWYSKAREQQRTIHLHVGPTNSGKTYNALKRLQEAKNGFYAGPLRLLAHEVYSRFRANGIPCDLVTGDDIRHDDDPTTKVSASTVEMVDVSAAVDVGVIDEIQMIGSEDRGWAWTRAFLGCNAKEVHLCGETRVVPLITELTASMGDTLKVHHYDRLNPLKAMSRSLRGNLKNLRKGDCIVSFSVVNIHTMKRQIEQETGRRCAIVYGSLPPETRAQQAQLFNDPNNDYDYLVASDAIGMGLNLSIKRIIFESVSKFNGIRMEQLSIPQLKQIAGRAGRYRSAQEGAKMGDNEAAKETKIGLVTCLDEGDLPIIQQAINSEPPPMRQAGILPPAELLESMAASLPTNTPLEYIMQRMSTLAKFHPRFKMCDLRDNLRLTQILDTIEGLTITERITISASPASSRDPRMGKVLQALARAIAEKQGVTVVDIEDIPLEVLEEEMRSDREYLQSLELLHQSLILFLWLSYRFSAVLLDQPMAFHAKGLCEEKINRALTEFSANPKLSARLKKIREAQALQKTTHIAEAALMPGENRTKTYRKKHVETTDENKDPIFMDWSEHPAEDGMFPGYEDLIEAGTNAAEEQQATEPTYEVDNGQSLRTAAASA